MAKLPLSRSQLNYALVGFVLVPAIANFVINGLIGWAMFRNANIVPLWGLGPSVGPDLLGTCFLLPLITCLIVTPMTRRHVQQGTVESLPELEVVLHWARGAFRPVLQRGALVGLASVVVVGSVVVAALSTLSVSELALQPFLILKTTFSVLLGLVVTPLIGFLALADPVPNVQAA